MNLAWLFGMIILCGVPAIVGGGIVWHFVPSWTAVIVWEVALFCVMAVVLARGFKKAEPGHQAH